MIDKLTEQRIRESARITDILRDCGVELTSVGHGNWIARNPFREDRSPESFRISESKNIAKDFATDETWGPIDFLLQCRFDATTDAEKRKAYPKALRYIADMYGIYVDDEPREKPAPIIQRPPMPKKDIIRWLPNIVSYYSNTAGNPLIEYLRSLPLGQIERKRLEDSIIRYKVGTYPSGERKGWTIWWQIEPIEKLVHTGKLMAYRHDGHRDKTANPYVNKAGKQCYYSFDFVHSIMERAGKWNSNTHEVQTCLFGLHLVDEFPNAEICLVESEKSALICSMFCDPNERLWMATTGKSFFNARMLKPLIDRGRDIVVYPDVDGYEDWEQMAKRIGYDRITISQLVKKQWIPADGEKADIADIMIRLLSGVTETEYDKACRRLHLKEHEPLKNMINTFDLKVQQ